MKSPITLGEYLFRRIHQVGIRSIHGVPSDFNLTLLDYVLSTGLHWVGNCNELNAGYAADGYSRIKGLSALVTTIGVGELSTLNSIAGAYSEQVSIIHIVGQPSRELQKQKIVGLHHMLGTDDFDVFVRMSADISCFAVKLNDIKEAPGLIDKAIRQAWLQNRPVYIGVPTDVVDMQLEAEDLLAHPLVLSNPDISLSKLEQAAEAIAAQIQTAQKPAIVVDIGTSQYRAQTEIRELVRLTGLPTFVVPSGRGVVDEDAPEFGGVYGGMWSTPGVREYVESADLVLRVGMLHSDLNTTGFSAQIEQNKLIEVAADNVQVRGQVHEEVYMDEVLRKVSEKLKTSNFQRQPSLFSHKESNDTASHDTNPNLKHEWLWPTMGQWLQEGDVVIAEAGTSSCGSWLMKFPKDATFISQHRWASIGYTVGACQGAALAVRDSDLPDRRTILFVGDGSIQMTVQEISTMLRNGLKPIIFVICNNGYTVERYVHGWDAVYNDIQPWNFTKLLEGFGGKEGQYATHQIYTKKELASLLADESFSQPSGLQLVELYLPQDDAPQSLKFLCESAKNRNKRQ